jgi:hypothetical protein
MSDQLLTTDDISADTLRGAAAIAAYTGHTERQINHLLEHNRLPAVKIGGRWILRKSTYRAFIAQLEARALSKIAA